MVGICEYCGQAVEVGDCAAPDEVAWEFCDCREARHRQRLQAQIDEALEHLEEIFGERAEEYNHLPPVQHASLYELLRCAVAEVGTGHAANVSVGIPGGGVAVIRAGSKGEIRVSRRMSRVVTAEASM